MQRRLRTCLMTLAAAAMLSTPGLGLAQEREKAADAKPAETKPGEQETGRQRRGEGAGIGQRNDRLQKALESLNLTDDQKSQIQKIQDETRQKMESMRDELRDLSPEDRRAKIRETVGDPLEKIWGLLNDEQKEQLREKLAAGEGEAGGRRERREGAQGRDGASTRPATRPSTQPADAAPRGRGPMIDRLKENLAKLDLTADQKTKVDVVLDEAAAQVAKLREEARAEPAALREQAMKIMEETRTKLQAILTPEQQKALQESMGQRQRSGAGRGEGDASPPPAGKVGKSDGPAGPPDKSRVDNSKATDSAPAKAAAASSSASADAEKAAKLAIGQPAPAFELSRVDGKSASLMSYRGKPTVLVFGSFTSPTFRDKAPAFEEIKKSYRGRVNFAVIYTREAHAVNEWEVQRNINEQIKVDIHVSLEDRTKMAKMTRDGMKLSMDVLVDDMDDGVATRYDAMPNGACVIDADGKIAGRQKWADAHGVKVILDELLRAK